MRHIEFKKQRNLGEILSDLVVMLICYDLYMYRFGNLLSFNVEISKGAVEGVLLFVVVAAFIMSIIIAYVLSHATTLFYIKSYANNNGTINFEQIKTGVYGSFLAIYRAG